MYGRNPPQAIDHLLNALFFESLDNYIPREGVEGGSSQWIYRDIDIRRKSSYPLWNENLHCVQRERSNQKAVCFSLKLWYLYHKCGELFTTMGHKTRYSLIQALIYGIFSAIFQFTLQK